MRTLLFVAFFFIAVLPTTAQVSMQGTVDVFRFEAESKPYVELFFYVLGSSIGSLPDSTAGCEIKYLIENEGGVVAGDKYNLVVPTEALNSDFMDLRRHYLEPGDYRFKAEVTDLSNSENKGVFTTGFAVETPAVVVELSDVQLLSDARTTDVESVWTKHGKRCVPLPFRFCGAKRGELLVYTELYRSDETLRDDFYIQYSVATQTSPDQLIIKRAKRLTPSGIIPLLQVIDVSRLTSGAYILNVDVFSRNNMLLAERSIEFTRSNPEADEELVSNMDKYFEYSFVRSIEEDSMRYALKAIAAGVSTQQVTVLNTLIKKGGLEEQQRFLHRYWVEKNPSDPEAAYIEYMILAGKIDKIYTSGMGYGFETDRGYIYMKYGAPDDIITVEDEPSAPPYEIWIYHYFPFTAQTNVRFLFYSPELANTYQLLHSTCETEMQNNAWEQILYKDALTETKGGDLLDARPVAPNWNRRAREYFTDF